MHSDKYNHNLWPFPVFKLFELFSSMFLLPAAFHEQFRQLLKRFKLTGISWPLDYTSRVFFLPSNHSWETLSFDQTHVHTKRICRGSQVNFSYRKSQSFISAPKDATWHKTYTFEGEQSHKVKRIISFR